VNSNKIKKLLAVETSCDDTSVAIVQDDGMVIFQLSASQDKEHEVYGGIVPEIASRNHSLVLLRLIEKCMFESKLDFNQIDGFAVTNRPGLIGSLIVGIMTVKSLSHSLKKPFIGVNHLEGHLLAPFLKDQFYSPPSEFNYPFLALAVSGGHSSIYLVNGPSDYTIVGMTKDDAAGEAFDKFGKMVGLGFPGGVRVDQMSKSGDRQAFAFPRSLINEESLMMSFSGLKSSAHRLVSSLSDEEVKNRLSDLCASFQESIVDVLISKLQQASRYYRIKRLVVTGGVSANSRLRERCEQLKSKGYEVVIPPLRYCTDNAAMIGYAGILQLNRGLRSDFNLGPQTNSLETDFKSKLWSI
jgi:N6-L-threonylcarbamoyladenine synthase